YEAVAHPVEGTVLTVATAAATAAEGATGDAAAVARAAHDGARAALKATPVQLAVLGRAGVVDAGGCGLVALLGALADALSGEATAAPVALRADAPLPEAGGHEATVREVDGCADADEDGPAFEV